VNHLQLLHYPLTNVMTHPGWIGGFPGDWSYQGRAKLLVGDISQLLTISLRLIFVEEAEIDVKLIWEGISDTERFRIARKMRDVRQQTLVIRKSIFLIGFFPPPFNINNGITSFNVLRFVTHSGFSEDIFEGKSDYFVQVRAYLNEEVSSMDETFNIEFENMPDVGHNKDFNKLEDDSSLYCALTSGYEVKCGKKYIAHEDHTLFYRKNIDTLYKFSFIDIMLPLVNEYINNLVTQEYEKLEVSLTRHLERTISDLCAFLSIVCDYEILPIYYDYSIYSDDKFIQGRIIPIWGRRKISKVSRSLPKSGIHFLSNITAFLECCPISKQLSRGMQHLKTTVYESSAELKLMAACSAIEYFYSYWFWEMSGLSKLIHAASKNDPLVDLHKDSINKLKKLSNSSSDKTPYLSTVIRFFLDDLGIDWQRYLKSKIFPQFIQIRNGLLHGSFVSDEVKIFEAEEVAQKLGAEILISIMKKISRAGMPELYENLPVRVPRQEFYTFSDGWDEIKNILDELHKDESSK